MNPRIIADIGDLSLVPEGRRVSGPGASWAMAPFVHVSPDRPSRFSDGSYGLYYAGDRLEVALFETAHHHARFMARTNEAPGWTSDFRQLIGKIDAALVNITALTDKDQILDPDDWRHAQQQGQTWRQQGFDGCVYDSVRAPTGQCVGLYWPDICGIPIQGKHFSYEWDGATVSRIRDLETAEIFTF
ncbi:MAG: RES family NAD+ phosphorylase [Pseudomonadota bacterium]